MIAPAFAQGENDLLVRMRRAHQEHAAVYLSRNTTFRIERKGDGFATYRDAEERKLILKDMSGRTEEKEVYYSEMVTLEKLEAYTMAPQGKGYKRMPAGSIEHRDERDDNIFHDDSKVASFVLPSLTSGAIAHVSHTLHFPDPRMTNGHFFAGMHPTEESILTIISDPAVEVTVRLFHLPEEMVTVSRTMERGRLVQRYVARQVPPLEFEDNAPQAKYYAPHAQLLVKLPDDESSDAVARLHAYLRNYVAVTEAPATPVLQALADSLTAGVSDPAEKATLIYRWVQRNVRYVAFEDGLRGVIPESAEEVHRLRYGDCKGMSNLLKTLLRAAELEAHLAWIGTRALPYTMAELPTSASSDHMIVALDLPTGTLFLDATASHNALHMPSGFTQEKEALITMGPDRWRVDRVPAPPPEANIMIDSVNMSLRGNDLYGSGTARFTGYQRYRLVRDLERIPMAKRKDLLRPVLMKGSNKFLLDDFTVEGMDDPTEALVVRYEFRIPDHAQRSGQRQYVQNMLSDPWSDLRARNDRKLPIEVPYRQEQRYHVTMQLPEGTRAIGIPSDEEHIGPAFGYSVHSTSDGRIVSTTSNYRLDRILLNEEIESWRDMNRSLQTALGRSMIIEHPAP
jgi:hypothetical protein